MTVRPFPQSFRAHQSETERAASPLSDAFANAIQAHINTLRGDARRRADRVFRSAKEHLAPRVVSAGQPEFIDLRNVVPLRPGRIQS